MNCCERCFKSKVIISLIRSLNIQGNCDFCLSSNVCIYNLNYDVGLDDKFNEILSIFKYGSELREDGYSPYNLISLKNEFEKRWNIFNGLDENNIHRLLHNLLKNRYPDKIEFLNTQVGIIEWMNNEFLEENSILKGKQWLEFMQYIKHENRFHSNFINYEVLKEFLSRLTIHINDEDFYRARISNDEELIADKMGAPPTKSATAGRANSEGISHLYLGSDINTVVSEIRPSVGDTVYVGKFPIRQELKIVDFRELKNLDVFEFEDATRFAINLKILNEMNNAISKPVRSGDSKLDYLPTQFIVDYIKSLNETESAGYDGIIFESTISEGHNLMLFNPTLISCTRVEKRTVESLSYRHIIFT